MFPLCNSEMGLGVHSDRTNSNLAPTPTTPCGRRLPGSTGEGTGPFKCPGHAPCEFGERDSQTPVGAYEHAWRRGAGRSPVCAEATPRRSARQRARRARARGRAARDGPRVRASRRASGWRGPRLPVRRQGGLLQSPGRALLPGECGLLYPGQGGRAGGRPGSGSLRPSRQ